MYQGYEEETKAVYSLQQQFSTFLMLQPFNSAPYVMGIPIIKLFHCYFVIVILLLL